jgi:uncharacterized protein YqeY
VRELGEIEARIKDDAVAALKAGDKRVRLALSTIVAELKKARIDSMKQPTEGDELAVLKRERKRRHDAIELFVKSDRAELAEQARFEARLLAGYMPEELSADALKTLVEEAVTASGAATPRDMGKVMTLLMPKVAGRADGRLLSDLVRARLGA